MEEAQRKRLAQEEVETEAKGRRWEGRSDDYLVGFTEGRTPSQQNMVLLEMQRRLIVSIKDFNKASSRLTRWMLWLTVAIGVIATLQLWAMLQSN